MYEVTFKFKPGMKVKNRLGDVGIVNVASINEDNVIKYWIDMPGGKGSWENEPHLEETE